MSHPMSGSVEKMKSDKLHRMTRDYGSADPASNISGPTNRMKQEGPEDVVGFGAESNAPKARSDRSSRKNTTMANPIATYANGGAVNRARGGRTKHKGSTHVNVIVAPQGGGGPGAAAGGPMLPPGGNPAAPPAPPMAPKPPMMPPPGMGPPGMGGAPGPMPPGGGMPGLRAGGGRTYAKGGRVHRDDGGQVNQQNQTAGDMSGASKVNADLNTPYSPAARSPGFSRAAPDTTGDKMNTTDSKGAMPGNWKSKGGAVARAMGGKVDMHAGAASGEGRLDKIKAYGKNAHEKPQAV